MSDVEQPQELLNQLLSQLHLEPGNNERAYGEVHGSPVTMTILSADPLALLFAFKIASSHSGELELSEEFEQLVEDGFAEVSLEDGTAWLTFYNLSEETSDSIQELVETFAEELSAAGLTLPPGCISCGRTEDSQLVFAEGTCTRICHACVEERIEEHAKIEEELNKPSSFFAVCLPLAFLYVAGGWLLFWALIDMFLRWKDTNELVVPGGVGLLIFAAILGAIGFGLGYPLGLFLRKSGLARRSPLVVSLPAIVVSCVAGEILYIAVIIFRDFRVFDILAAARLLVPFVQGYAGSWLVLKVLVICGIVGGCYVAAAAKKTAPLQI